MPATQDTQVALVEAPTAVDIFPCGVRSVMNVKMGSYYQQHLSASVYDFTQASHTHLHTCVYAAYVECTIQGARVCMCVCVCKHTLGHAMHLVEPETELEYVPAPQSAQVDSVLAPFAAEYAPDPQDSQPVAAVTADANVPFGQFTHEYSVLPPGVFENFPETQSTHTVAPNQGEYLPAQQLVQVPAPAVMRTRAPCSAMKQLRAACTHCARDLQSGVKNATTASPW